MSIEIDQVRTQEGLVSQLHHLIASAQRWGSGPFRLATHKQIHTSRVGGTVSFLRCGPIRNRGIRRTGRSEDYGAQQGDIATVAGPAIGSSGVVSESEYIRTHYESFDAFPHSVRPALLNSTGLFWRVEERMGERVRQRERERGWCGLPPPHKEDFPSNRFPPLPLPLFLSSHIIVHQDLHISHPSHPLPV